MAEGERRMRRRAARRGWRSSSSLALLVLSLSAPVRADDPAPQRSWDLELLGYGFLTAVDLSANVGDISVDETIRFADVFDDLKWALMGGGELRYERALLLVDVIGAQLRTDESVDARTRPFQLTQVGPGGDLTVGPADGWLRTTLWIADFKAGLNAVNLPYTKLFGGLAPEDRRSVKLDVFAGARYWNVRNKVHLDVTPGTLRVGNTTVDLGSVSLPRIDIGDLTVPGRLLRGGSRSNEVTVDWVDPIIAFRVRADLTETISTVLLGDCGGWSIGSAARFTWQGMAGFRWQFSDHFHALVAYRGLQVRRSGDVDKLTLYGPMVGLGVRF